jgi:hypothetical protein
MMNSNGAQIYKHNKQMLTVRLPVEACHTLANFVQFAWKSQAKHPKLIPGVVGYLNGALASLLLW